MQQLAVGGVFLDLVLGFLFAALPLSAIFSCHSGILMLIVETLNK
jgi:hypothetical protein